MHSKAGGSWRERVFMGRQKEVVEAERAKSGRKRARKMGRSFFTAQGSAGSG
jgi:hypothetical protein